MDEVNDITNNGEKRKSTDGKYQEIAHDNGSLTFSSSFIFASWSEKHCSELQINEALTTTHVMLHWEKVANVKSESA